ncbi:hypothetical protein NMG60_11012540 [Bertholletia excelsa]
MASSLVLCFMLAEVFSVFVSKAYGTEDTDPGGQVVVVNGFDAFPVPAPAPSVLANRRVMRWHQHHRSEKSAAGGDVILGGFALALVAAIFCYIRITRRTNQHPRSQK